MKDWTREPVLLMCEMCGDRLKDVMRFGLTIRNQRTAAGGKTTLGAGGISLCQRCWKGLNCHRQRAPRRAA